MTEFNPYLIIGVDEGGYFHDLGYATERQLIEQGVKKLGGK